MNRTANATIYVQEELTDARLRLEELKGYISRALDLVDGSAKRDHFYGTAGDLISAIPQTIMKIDKALSATALAMNKIDYEEIRMTLRPEKVDALESMLEEVRMRVPRRTGRLTDYGDRGE